MPFFLMSKKCQQTKFELSKWTLTLSVPIFLFRSLNKLGPLVTYPKIGYTARPPIGPGQSIPVSSPSNHLLGYFWSPNRRTVDNPICSCTSLAYVVRLPTLKRKSGCPTGINYQTLYSGFCVNQTIPFVWPAPIRTIFASFVL